MRTSQTKYFQWSIIGAGPAGLASVGLLLESGVSPEDILLIDPNFMVGDFGQHWGEVNSNTTIELFLRFLSEIKGFFFDRRPSPFTIESKSAESFCQLQEVSEALSWITAQLRATISTHQGYVQQLRVNNGQWEMDLGDCRYQSAKVILTTGAVPKTLSYDSIEEISLYDALKPSRLQHLVRSSDCVAVFGSSHSSMIIMKSLLEAGVNSVYNFYLSPHRYAVKMDGWILYDNTGLKGETAQWVRENICHCLDPRINRYLSNEKNISTYLPKCNKAIYPIGFKSRAPQVLDIDTNHYDKNTGILAPGLFGAGIAFPLLKTNPLGGQELNVGLYKFMHDIRRVLPVWQQYNL